LLFVNDLANSIVIETILFADYMALVQSDNNLKKLHNSVIREMAKLIDWLTAIGKFSLNISKTKFALIVAVIRFCPLWRIESSERAETHCPVYSIFQTVCAHNKHLNSRQIE